MVAVVMQGAVAVHLRTSPSRRVVDTVLETRLERLVEQVHQLRLNFLIRAAAAAAAAGLGRLRVLLDMLALLLLCSGQHTLSGRHERRDDALQVLAPAVLLATIAVGGRVQHTDSILRAAASVIVQCGQLAQNLRRRDPGLELLDDALQQGGRLTRRRRLVGHLPGQEENEGGLSGVGARWRWHWRPAGRGHASPAGRRRRCRRRRRRAVSPLRIVLQAAAGHDVLQTLHEPGIVLRKRLQLVVDLEEEKLAGTINYD